MAATGCEQCRGSRYAGRFTLGEMLAMTPPLKALVARRAAQADIQGEAQRSRWCSLRGEQALDAAARGVTTLEEVDRVAA